MKKIGIVPNTDRDLNLYVTKRLIEFLYNMDCYICMERKTIEQYNIINVNSVDDIYKEVDFIVVLGGDGSILRVAKFASIFDIPILGINLGHLGYLTDVEKSGAKKALENVLNKNYKKEKRMMIECSIATKDYEDIVLGNALNDICIMRSVESKLIELDIFVNDHYIDTYRADGVIITTPTGSTAYNLSAGGPILKPDAEMIAITPVCPHTLYARPFVLSSDDVINIKQVCNLQNEAVIYMDGVSMKKVNHDEIISIKKSKNYTTILKTNKLGFYDVLRLKMVGEVRK